MPTTYRVLMVEDEPAQAELMRDYLRITGPFEVDWAGSLALLWQCLQAAEPPQQPYSVILLDYRLPDGTGLQALQELARRGNPVPVIMITGQGDERLAVQAMQTGAVDYLVKGSEYLANLPGLIRKAVRSHDLQAEVQRSLEQVRYQALLLNNVRDAIVVWNTAGVITYWNPAAEALFGQRAAERVGQPVEKAYLNSFFPPVRQPPREGTTGQELERCYHLPGPGPDAPGKDIWVSSRVAALRDYGSDGQNHSGRLIGYMDVVRDITARKHAEDALRRRLEVEKLVSSISAHFIDLSPAQIDQGIQQALEAIGLFTGVERSFVALANSPASANGAGRGYTWQAGPGQAAAAFDLNAAPWMLAVLGRYENLTLPALSALPPAAWRERSLLEAEGISALLAAPLIYSGELLGMLALARQGAPGSPASQPWTQEQAALLRTVGETIANALERKRLEQQIQAAQARLAQSARQAAFGELASGVAHHINNPLAVIIAEAQLLLQALGRSQPALGPARESAEAIEAAGWRVQAAVQRLLDFSQQPASAQEPVAVNASLENALALVGGALQAAGAQVNLELAPGLPPVQGSPAQLGDLWVNLLLLARDAAHTLPAESPPLQVLVRSAAALDGRQAACVEVQIGDNGAPIPPAELENLSEPNFFRTLGGRGAGMELTLCQELVRQHHGQLTVRSAPEGGAVFCVTLPCEAPPAQATVERPENLRLESSYGKR